MKIFIVLVHFFLLLIGTPTFALLSLLTVHRQDLAPVALLSGLLAIGLPLLASYSLLSTK